MAVDRQQSPGHSGEGIVARAWSEDVLVHRLDLPFVARGRPGRVRVRIQPNQDPTAAGHAAVAPNFDHDAFRGFPVMTADVDHRSEGPAGWFAWVQSIRHVRAGQTITAAIDTPPWLVGPWYVIGYHPTLADAPCHPDHLNQDWIATSWLVTLQPGSGGVDRPVPIAGFVWGYRRGADSDPTVVLAPRAAQKR